MEVDNSDVFAGIVKAGYMFAMGEISLKVVPWTLWFYSKLVVDKLTAHASQMTASS